MGITARGAWESVKRHFRALGIDTQSTDFTVAGIGDMSGDVFGNGMLLSPHIRLQLAFDHRHIFIDPAPDAARAFAERQRLFALPRSSWDDYDKSLISAGGGVFSRSAKSISLSPQACAVLGIEARELTPPELLQAILLAPVDLLYNGGIGTYVKASFETHAQVGDRPAMPSGSTVRSCAARCWPRAATWAARRTAGSSSRKKAGWCTPMPSTTRPVWTARTMRSTSRSCSVPSSRPAT
jgi:NAD-specific glutamate dehydrogenase